MLDKYGEILRITKNIKNELGAQIIDAVTYGEDVTDLSLLNKEIDILASITGQCAGAIYLRNKNLITPIDDKKGFVKITINNESYPVNITKLPQDLVTDMGLQKNTNNTPIHRNENNKESVHSSSSAIHADDVNIPQNDVSISQNDQTDENVNEVNEDYVWTPNAEANTEDIEDISEKADETINLTDSDTAENNYEDEVAPADIYVNDKGSEIEDIKAEVYGEVTTPPVTPMNRDSLFIEEKVKRADEFVFCEYKISVAHKNCRPEDIYFTVSPLKIKKYATPSVPILVTAYYKGKVYYESSYKNNEDGRNLITMEINEYYFLIRGSFDENGKFDVQIMTTGISVNQGDTLTILSKDEHTPVGDKVKNGHIKFKYDSYEGDTIVEIFPLGIGTSDFVIIERVKDFVDYKLISDGKYGYKRYLVYDKNKDKAEVVCNWIDDVLETDIVPA